MASTGSSVGALADAVGGKVVGDESVNVIDVTHDSRMAAPGVMFVAVTGATHDGHDFVDQAIANGAGALCVTRPVDATVPQVVIEDTRRAMGPMASVVHGNPSHQVPVIGVTGTNGKTTVTHHIESIASRAGLFPGLIGTIATRVGDVTFESARTTPEATDFQRLLARMRDEGADVIATEVSSHALALERVAATRFAVAAFTNLSQDHLDFHGTMSNYRKAKERLFTDYDVGTAVINIDDPVGREIAGNCSTPLFTVGRAGDLEVTRLEPSLTGTRFEVRTGDTAHTVTAPIIGGFSVANAAMAAACCLALGLGIEEVLVGLQGLDGVPGRFELVSGEGPVRVLVDYAHTPDGVRQAIHAASRITQGRVIAVIGAGGDRDVEKRPLMGEAASAADVVVVTSDNPRSEDPQTIVDQVAGGVGREVVREADRRTAIGLAVEAANDGDVVLILGKGHETGQEVGGMVLPFDDRATVRELLGIGSVDSGARSGSMFR